MIRDVGERRRISLEVLAQDVEGNVSHPVGQLSSTFPVSQVDAKTDRKTDQEGAVFIEVTIVENLQLK